MGIASYKPVQNIIAVQWDGSDEALRQIRAIIQPRKAELLFDAIVISLLADFRFRVGAGEWVLVLYDEMWSCPDKVFQELYELIAKDKRYGGPVLTEAMPEPTKGGEL